MPQFVSNVEEIRRRAMSRIEKGAVTENYRGSVDQTVEILNEALATEIVCVLRYMHHYFMATGVHGKSIADEFKEHADAEREHADMLAERIQQLGGKPDFNPRSLLERSVSQYVEGETLAEMIREDLIAERIVIEVYQDMIRHFGSNDPTTRIIIERILEDEEEHASDLVDLLYIADPQTGKTEGKDPGADPLHIDRQRSNQQRDQRRLDGKNRGRRSDSREKSHSGISSSSEREHVGNPRERDQFLRGEAAEIRGRERSEMDPLQPDFYSRSEGKAAHGWRPGEREIRASETASKRHESAKAGPPGSPEFSAGGTERVAGLSRNPKQRAADRRAAGRRKKPAA